MREIRSLTGIRGFAAFLVVLFHYNGSLCLLLPQFKLLSPIIQKGAIGVDLFFILSGFILTYVYTATKKWDKINCVQFLIKRFARIYPIHLITLLCLLLMVAGASLYGVKLTGVYTTKEFFNNVFLLQAFPISSSSWNYPSWSISAEFFGYLCIFPLTVFMFRCRRIRSIGLILSVLIIVLYLYMRSCGIFGAWSSIARISFEFVAGAALYHGVNDSDIAKKIAARLIMPWVIIAVTACFLADVIKSDQLVMEWLVISCLGIIAGLSADEGFVSRFLGMNCIRYFGLISYSLYMSHALVEKALKVILPAGNYMDSDLIVRILIFMVYIVVPLLVAMCFYHWCEEPCRRLIQRKTRRWTQRAAVLEST